MVRDGIVNSVVGNNTNCPEIMKGRNLVENLLTVQNIVSHLYSIGCLRNGIVTVIRKQRTNRAYRTPNLRVDKFMPRENKVIT